MLVYVKRRGVIGSSYILYLFYLFENTKLIKINIEKNKSYIMCSSFTTIHVYKCVQRIEVIHSLVKLQYKTY